MRRAALVALGLAVFPALRAVPQQGEAAGGGFTVHLVTFGPGPRVWERFGHNGLWFRDRVTGDGPIYDYGRFSFEQENFLLKFALGDMQYWMGRDDGVHLINQYIGAGRSVWTQELNLPEREAGELLRFLEANLARDQGRYRYDYYRDNCSTRIRDAIDRITGGAVRAVLDTSPTGTSYRFHTRRSLEHNLAFYGIVMAALGAPTDRPITEWEAAFLPLELQRHLRDVTVRDSTGRLVPLVRAEATIAQSDRYAVADRPRPGPAVFFAGLGAVLGLLTAAQGYLGRAGGWARRGFVVLAGFWALAATVAALLILWFWGLSDHRAAHQNANIFQFNLLAALLFIALSRLAAGVRGSRREVRLAAAATAALALLGPVVEWLAGWEQQNAEVVGFALSLHLGVLVGAVALAGATSPSPSSVPPPPQ